MPLTAPLLHCPAVAPLGALRADPSEPSWVSAPPLHLAEGAAVRGVWEPEAWRLLWLDPHGAGPFGVAIDPEGDGAAFFEVLITPEGRLEHAFCRRNRSGWRRHPGWVWEGAALATALREGAGWCAEVRLPFAQAGERLPPASWHAAFRRGPGRIWPRFGGVYWGAHSGR